MAQIPSTSGFEDLSPQDLQDKYLWKLNLTLRRLWEKIGTLFTPGSTPSYASAPTFSTVKASSQTMPPNDPNEFITRGNADKLYSAAVQRSALLSGVNPAAQFQPTASPVTQPLPFSASSFVSDILRYGTHGNRPLASSVGAGTFYEETDRNVLYQNQIVSNAAVWTLIAGEMRATQATLPADLGTNDTGFIVQVTDFNHRLVWSGTAWGWAPGDEGSGKGPIPFEIDPSPTTGWALYDGSTVTYLKSDGTTGSIALPDLTSAANKAAYLKLGSPDSGPNAAVAPTVTGGGGNTGSATTGVTNPSATGATAPGAGSNNSASVAVQSGAGTTVAADPHTHTSASHTHTIGAPTDPGHVHTLGALSAGTNGEPRNLERRPWFRL